MLCCSWEKWVLENLTRCPGVIWLGFRPSYVNHTQYSQPIHSHMQTAWNQQGMSSCLLRAVPSQHWSSHFLAVVLQVSLTNGRITLTHCDLVRKRKEHSFLQCPYLLGSFSQIPMSRRDRKSLLYFWVSLLPFYSSSGSGKTIRTTITFAIPDKEKPLMWWEKKCHPATYITSFPSPL